MSPDPSPLNPSPPPNPPWPDPPPMPGPPPPADSMTGGRQGGQGRIDDFTRKGLRTAVALSTASCLMSMDVLPLWSPIDLQTLLHSPGEPSCKIHLSVVPVLDRVACELRGRHAGVDAVGRVGDDGEPGELRRSRGEVSPAAPGHRLQLHGRRAQGESVQRASCREKGACVWARYACVWMSWASGRLPEGRRVRVCEWGMRVCEWGMRVCEWGMRVWVCVWMTWVCAAPEGSAVHVCEWGVIVGVGVLPAKMFDCVWVRCVQVWVFGSEVCLWRDTLSRVPLWEWVTGQAYRHVCVVCDCECVSMMCFSFCPSNCLHFLNKHPSRDFNHF